MLDDSTQLLVSIPDLDRLGRRLARTYIRHGFFQMFCLIDKLDANELEARTRVSQQVFQDSHRDVDPRLLLLPWAEDRQCLRLWGCRPVRAWSTVLAAQGLLPAPCATLEPPAWRTYLAFLLGARGMPTWVRLKRTLDTERRLRRRCEPVRRE